MTLKMLYKKKRIVKIICPEKLEFEPGCIRNVMIEFLTSDKKYKKGDRVITNLQELTKVKYSPMDNFI